MQHSQMQACGCLLMRFLVITSITLLIQFTGIPLIFKIIKMKSPVPYPFKKAFDTVNHELLIKKFNIFGIKDIALNWIKSYLSNRTQQTQIGNNLSNEREVLTGVPQGSILGPTFFLCYINDIVYYIHARTIRLVWPFHIIYTFFFYILTATFKTDTVFVFHKVFQSRASVSIIIHELFPR